MNRSVLRRSFVAVLLMLGYLAAIQAEARVEPKARSTKLGVTADTWIDEGSAEQAHGDEEGLTARFSNDKGSRVLLAFDLERIRDAHIESASLTLEIVESEGDSFPQMAVSGLTTPFEESVSWSNQPARTKTYGIQGVPESPGDVAWDLTALFQETIEATGRLGGVAISGPLIAGTIPYGRTFASSESATPPRLVVAYVPGEASRLKAKSPEKPAPTPGAGQIRLVLGLILVVLLVAGIVVFLLLRLPR